MRALFVFVNAIIFHILQITHLQTEINLRWFWLTNFGSGMQIVINCKLSHNFAFASEHSRNYKS